MISKDFHANEATKENSSTHIPYAVDEVRIYFHQLTRLRCFTLEFSLFRHVCAQQISSLANSSNQTTEYIADTDVIVLPPPPAPE